MSIGISKAKVFFVAIVATLFLYCAMVTSSFATDDASAKAQTMRQTGKQLLEIGYEHYRRGMYDDAKTAIEKASAYKDYLSISDASKLDELLTKLSSQPSKAEEPTIQNTATAAELLSQARSLVSQGQYAQAKEKYQDAEQTGQLSDQELSAVEGEIAAIEKAIAAQQQPPVVIEQSVPVQQEPVIVEQPMPVQPVQEQQPAVNSEYIEFVPIDANDINQQIPMQMPVAQPPVNPEFVTPAPDTEVNYVAVDENEVKPSQPVQSAPVPTPQELEKESYIEVVKQKQRIQQSYTKAIVNEAIEKAKESSEKQDFARAKDEISRASSVVEKNKLLLEGQDYTQYTTTLKQLLDEINTKQSQIESQKAEKAKVEAQASQEKLRSQQAADKQQRIKELLAHAQEYQEQQRYDEALSQVETLLAIDPTNKEAVRSKRMLEDIINLRKQLEIKREINRQERDVFTDNQRSMIPHAELMKLPDNWQDIAAKRKPTIISGLPAYDAAVYKQLETAVDLTNLTPDTPLDEAIEAIRVSVDPPLKIVVRWKDLADNAYLEPDTVIGMQGLNGIPVGKALKELLDTVSGGVVKIDFAIEEGIITIATKESLPGKLIARVYDVADIVATKEHTAQMQSMESIEGGSSTQLTETGAATVTTNIGNIIQTIQAVVSPESWLINGGEGTIQSIGNKLVINQTPVVHEQVQKLLMEDLRESLGQQVSIEARFLFVTENFLEDIGMGVSRINIKSGAITDKLGSMVLDFGGSASNVNPTSTAISGTLGGISSPSVQLLGGVQYGSVLDDLSVSFFMKAIQAHRDSKILTAPRVTVLSGERARLEVGKEVAYVSDYEFEDLTSTGDNPIIRTIADPTTDEETSGVTLEVVPTISADKKYVILLIDTMYTKLTLQEFQVSSTTSGEPFPISLPLKDISKVQTRVSVPDSGTLLIGGQKLGAEVNQESGVPGVSKIPVLGRLFSSRSKVKDQDVLLILVKPTIIIQHEAEREYFAPLDE